MVRVTTMERLLFDELAGEAVRELLRAVRGTFLRRSTVERLSRNVEPLLPLVQNHHAAHRSAGELAALRWNVYCATQLVRRMEAADRGITRWLACYASAHMLDGVRRLRDEADARIGRLERRVEEVAVAVAAQTALLPSAMSVPVALLPPLKAMGMAMEVGVEVKRGREKRGGMVMWP